MDDAESRFTHLLQPIRDLTKNWEVDVAAQLGEYLDELDQISISFDGGKTTMNFAEAALLIQGSACIYSKKVEYLYSLVCQALDFVSNKKRDRQVASVGQDGVDNDATFAYRNEEEEFLSLDDISNGSKTSVDLKRDTNPNAVEIVPLTPMALVAAEDAEKKINPLYSRNGEILGSCKDFRMNTYTPHGQGTFLLDLAEMTPLQFLRDLHMNNQNNSVLNGAPMDLNGNMPQDLTDHEAPLPVLNLSPREDRDPPCDDAADWFIPLEDDNGMEVEPGSDTHIDRHQAPSDRYLLRERIPPEPPAEKTAKEALDPWRSLDPFSCSEDKPLKKGKHYTVPRSVQETDGNKRKRKSPSKLLDFMKWLSGASSEVSCRKLKKGPTFADMELLYWKHMKEKLAAQRKLLKKKGALYPNEAPEQPHNVGGDEEERDEAEVVRHDDYLDNDQGDVSGPEDFVDEPEEIAEDQDLVITASQGDVLNYEDLVRKNVDLFIANSQKYAQETVLSLRVKEWEDKMGPQLTAQEERLAFDIHDYGNKIIDAFSCVSERRTFASIVRGKEEFEVCRYMLASLQLANDYTVEIHKNAGLEEAIDTMELTLLSKQRAHERFKTYSAPSITDNFPKQAD
ncbi:condensin-2 complex subunit H2 isoform X1 [Amia ocellicauda]|uniref:condensin-2 complex subunit H2 isoform X1 n=1 Tax=Amia ocellicauda TaxID=2972642 RepID=UPI0034645222